MLRGLGAEVEVTTAQEGSCANRRAVLQISYVNLTRFSSCNRARRAACGQ